MPGDREIQRIFEIADDGMQGVLGYYYFVAACHNAAMEPEILKGLPPDAIPITHNWKRYYNPNEMMQSMRAWFSFYHARLALVSIVSIFESGLSNFIERLNETEKLTTHPKGKKYKHRLEWAFDFAKRSVLPDPEMVQRIPDLCLDIDHARRIRNLYMHNNGVLDELYGTDGILVDGRPPIIDPLYDSVKQKTPAPFLLEPESFEIMTRSHIELLHHLHDTIQRTFFDVTRGYSYRDQNKSFAWHRLLIGT